MGTAGFLIGGGWGALCLAISWSALVCIFRLSSTLKDRAQAQSEDISSPDSYAEIDEIFVGLGGIARERGWDIDKRLEIARFSCERSGMTLDELEKLYDGGVRSLLGKKPQQGSQSTNNNESAP